MALLKRSELLQVTEAIPGEEATPTWAGSHAVDVLELNFNQDRSLNPRQTAKSSLSRTVEAIGRGSANITFAVDAKGSGNSTIPPDYAETLEACLMNLDNVVTLVFTASQTITVGDLLTGGTSGATAIVLKSASSISIPVYVLSGTFSGAETINSAYKGASTGSTAATPIGSTFGLCWRPWSQPALTFATTANWSSNPAVGETFTSTTTGNVVEGGGTIIAVNTTTTTCEWNWGTLTAGSALASTSGETATVNGTPTIVQTEGKTLTMRPNRDGLARPVFGGRGTFALQGEAGGQARFNFTFTGKAGTPTDIATVTGTSFATTVPPRLVGGTALIDGIALPVKSYQLDVNNTVVMRADANSAEGDMRAEITDRDPSLTLEIDQVGVAAMNLWSKWQSGQTSRIGLQLGTLAGNSISIAAGAAQISEINDGDVDGVATHTVTYMLRGESTDGDDEFFIGHV